MRTRVLSILVVIYVFNFVDRNLLSILLNSIKADLEVSDTMMGFLVGPAFALFYTFAGIPIARLADRHPRRLVLAVGLAVWSLATACSGLVRNFAQMAVARVAVGVGEASATPSAHSMISDIFPPARRASAMAIYNMGASIGIFAGMAFGGWLHDSIGWRNAFIIVGVPGALFAVMLRFILPEPRRGEVENLVVSDEQPSFAEVVRHLLAQRSFRHVLAAAGLYSITAYGMTTWAAPFMERVHGLSPGEFGLQLGLVVGVFGALGSLGAGFLTDALAKRDERWLLWIAALGGSLLVPFLAAFALCPTPGLAMLLFIPANVFNQFYAAPSYAVTQGLAQLRMRAMASAIILFVINLVGLGLGPQLIGIGNDLLEASYGDEAIRYSLAVLGLFNLWAAGHSILGARHLRADLERARNAAAD
ncbi:MAG: MFS transporter [Myxococcales bacterium]|nr:MFS transporter [Myxococcales bacterium]